MKSIHKDEDDSGKEHTAMDMLRKYGMHDDVQENTIIQESGCSESTIIQESGCFGNSQKPLIE